MVPQTSVETYKDLDRTIAAIDVSPVVSLAQVPPLPGLSGKHTLEIWLDAMLPRKK